MKFKALMICGLIPAMCITLFAQQPPAGGGQGAPGGAAGARGGGPPRGGGGGGGRGGGAARGTRAPGPAATGPVADATRAILAAINNKDSAFFRTALGAEAIMVDEDGHLGEPAAIWTLRMASASKKMTMSNLMVGDLGDGGAWAAFNYTLDEATPQGQPTPTQGSATIVYSKSGTDLKAVVIQLSINGKAIFPHTGQP